MVLAGLARCRAGVVCAVFAQRVTGAFVTGEAKQRAEDACVETGLEAVAILAEFDRQKRRRRRAVATVDLAEAPEMDAERPLRAAPRKRRRLTRWPKPIASRTR